MLTPVGAGRVGDRRRHAGDVRRGRLAELEGTDVEERPAAEPDVGRVRVVLAEVAELVALAGDRRVVERGGVRRRARRRPLGSVGEDRARTRRRSPRSAGGLAVAGQGELVRDGVRVERAEVEEVVVGQPVEVVADAAGGVEDLVGDRDEGADERRPVEVGFRSSSLRAASIAAEPARSWKLPLAGLRNIGSPMTGWKFDRRRAGR